MEICFLICICNYFFEWENIDNFFILKQKSVGTPGLTGLDRLLSFMIVTELQSLIRLYEKMIGGDKVWQEQLKNIHSSLDPVNKLIGMYEFKFIFHALMIHALKVICK